MTAEQPGAVAVKLLALAKRLYEHRAETACLENGFSRFLQGHGVYTYLQSRGCVKRDDFKQLTLRTAGFSFHCATALERILESLSRHHVPALTFKGVAWALLAYGDILTRPFGDLDILIPRSHWPEAKVALAACGYGCEPHRREPAREAAFLRYSKCQEVPNPRHAPELDLHIGLYSQWIAFETPFADLWARRAEVHLDNIGPFPTFGKADAIIFTCLHSYQDGWAYMKGLLDLALLLERHQPDWCHLVEIAKERTPMIEMAVAFAVQLLGAPVPRGWSVPFDPETTLAIYLDMASLSEPPQLGLLAPKLWSGSRLLALGRSVRAVCSPSDEDLNSVRLPRPLIGLYPLIRVVRLLSKVCSRRKFK